MPAAEIVGLVTGIIGCVVSVATATPCVRLPLEECYGHLKDHEEKLQKLYKDHEKLKELLEISDSLGNTAESAPIASHLYNQVELVLPDSLESHTLTADTLFCWCLPNYHGRYKKGKFIASVTEELKELISKLQLELHIHSDDMDEYQNRGNLRITRKLVGLYAMVVLREIFYTIEIWHWRLRFKRSKKLVIGVCGASRIGKTEVVAHVFNSLLRRRDLFDNLIWVEASSEDDLKKLQMKIASKMDLNLSSENSVLENAAMIMNALKKKKTCLLVLDNLSRAFSLEEIGIQLTSNGSYAVIITSQSSSVCSQMKSDKIMALKLLSDGEAHKLLKDEIGSDALRDLTEEVESILKNVAEECGGLPLAIITAAAHFRKLNWNNHVTVERALKKEHAAFKEYTTNVNYKEDEVLKNLISNLMLGDKQLKNSYIGCIQACFLFCTLYPRNHAFVEKELMEYWMWDGLLGDIECIDDRLGEAEEIFDELKDACLLQGVDDEKGLELVKIHPFLWDILFQTNKGSPYFFTKAENVFRDSLYEDWPEDVERVSLMRNNLKELQSGPTFLKLSTLLLQYNPLDIPFHDDFFNSFPNLQLVDLSNTGVCILPNSLLELKKLKALLLRKCWGLTSLPSVSKLTALMVLDFSGSPVTQLPLGMDFLTKLLRLDISRTRVRGLARGLVTKLCNLQHLLTIGCEFPWISGPLTQAEKAACIEDLKQLENLSVLEINFLDTQVFLNYISSEQRLQLRIRTFKFCVGGLYNGKMGNNSVAFMKEFPTDPFRLPDKASELLVMQCNDIIHMKIPSNDLGNVKILDVSYCAKLKCLFKQDNSSNLILPNLEQLVIAHCPNMKMICEIWSIKLPKLQKLTLFNLPQLLSSGTDNFVGMHCDSIRTIAVWKCSNLKKFPIHVSEIYGTLDLRCLKEIKGEKPWFQNLELSQSKATLLEKLFTEEPPPEELISRGKMMAKFEPESGNHGGVEA